MEWQQIIGFYHAAGLRSFTAAAEATFRTQSAVSQQIQALEEELDCKLCERVSKRNLKLTPEGERFLKFAALVVQEFESLKEEIEEFKGSKRGHLKIAAPFTTLYHLFPEVVKRYTSQFPGVELTLLDRRQERVIELVRNGEIDFGFILDRMVTKDLLTIRWKEVETVLMVPPGHPLCALRRVTLKQLAKYPLILPPRHLEQTGRIALEEQFRELGLDYRIVMESSNVELSSVYVEMGLGISFARIVRDLPALKQRKIEFLSLSHLFESGHIALVMRRDKAMAAHKKAFIVLLSGERGMLA
ncbi:MAG: LysR family transcriptional regulator [Syntrophobacteraceae bacterium]